MSCDVSFQIVRTTEEFMAAMVVRGIVFCEEQNCPWEIEKDAEDGEAVHVLGLCGTEPAAAARFRFVPGYAKLERICIRKQWRKTGAGKALVTFLIDAAKKRGATAFKMHAQAHLEGFYAGLGFQGEGEIFDEAGIPHRLMIRKEEADGRI